MGNKQSSNSNDEYIRKDKEDTEKEKRKREISDNENSDKKNDKRRKMNNEELLATCPNSSQNESEGDKDEDPQIINLKTTKKKNKSTRHNQSPITDLNCLRREPMSIITKTHRSLIIYVSML